MKLFETLDLWFGSRNHAITFIADQFLQGHLSTLLSQKKLKIWSRKINLHLPVDIFLVHIWNTVWNTWCRKVIVKNTFEAGSNFIIFVNFASTFHRLLWSHSECIVKQRNVQQFTIISLDISKLKGVPKKNPEKLQTWNYAVSLILLLHKTWWFIFKWPAKLELDDPDDVTWASLTFNLLVQVIRKKNKAKYSKQETLACRIMRKNL